MVPLASFAVILALLVVPAAHATADSITITTVTVLQNQGFTEVDLGAHPGATVNPTDNHNGKSELAFKVVFPAVPQDQPVTFDTAFHVDGVTLERIRTGTLFAGGSGTAFLEGFDPGFCCFQATPGSIAVTLEGVTKTFSFTLIDPAPEPGTWVLAVTAVSLLARSDRRSWFFERTSLSSRDRPRRVLIVISPSATR